MTLSYNIAKRGIEAVHGYTKNSQNDGPEEHQIPALGAFIFFLTLMFFFFLMGAITYTYGHLITTLCMVESSSSQAYVPIGSVEPADDAPPAYTEDGLPKPADAEINLVRTEPITASLRTTIVHLKARAGFWSRFRGLGVYLVWNVGRGFITGIISAGSRNPFFTIIASILAEVALVSSTKNFAKTPY